LTWIGKNGELEGSFRADRRGSKRLALDVSEERSDERIVLTQRQKPQDNHVIRALG
jgi:hypothetical protein